MKNFSKVKLGGFTLIELLVVVLIIGILAAIALPQYQMAVEKTRIAEANIILKAIKDASVRKQLEQPNFWEDSAWQNSEDKWEELDISFPLTVFPDDPLYIQGKDFYYALDEFPWSAYAGRGNGLEDPTLEKVDYFLDFYSPDEKNFAYYKRYCLPRTS